MEAKLVAFDPGESNHTGVAVWMPDEENKTWVCTYNKSLGTDDLDEFVTELQDCETFVIEEYVVFAHKAKAHIGSKVITARVIGALQLFARLKGIKVVMQPSSILKIAELWSGLKVPSKRPAHDEMSAYLHGYHYLTKNDLMPMRVVTDYGKSRKGR